VLLPPSHRLNSLEPLKLRMPKIERLVTASARISRNNNECLGVRRRRRRLSRANGSVEAVRCAEIGRPPADHFKLPCLMTEAVASAAGMSFVRCTFVKNIWLLGGTRGWPLFGSMHYFGHEDVGRSMSQLFCRLPAD
jgi:hypothetical protein